MILGVWMCNCYSHHHLHPPTEMLLFSHGDQPDLHFYDDIYCEALVIFSLCLMESVS